MAERDPFSAPGISTSGDGDPLPHFAEARRRMYFAKLIADTAGIPVWRSVHRTEDGGPVFTTNIAGPVERVHIHIDPVKQEIPPGEPAPLARLAWVPRGFTLTPRTAEAPDGYGMPPTPDGKGTPGGPLTQVIINRYPGNQYPEAIYAYYTGGTMATANTVAGSLFYEDWELIRETQFAIGTQDNTPADPEERKWRPQFSARYLVQLPEPKALDGTWFCHRPQYAGEDGPTALLRERTNVLRAAANRAPLGPALRGWAGEFATDIVYQIQYSDVFGHTSRLFRPGHQTFGDRVGVRGGWNFDAGENIAYRQGNHDLEFAAGVAEQWANSPEHYANMIENWEVDGTKYAFMDFASGPATVNAFQPPPYELDTPTVPILPPVSARVASQIFAAESTWVHAAGGRSGEVNIGGVPLDDQDMFPAPYRVSRPSGATSEYTPHVTFLGRIVMLSDGPADAETYRVLAAATRLDQQGRVILRVAALTRFDAFSVASLTVHEGRIDDFLATRQEVGSFEISPVSASQMGRPRFSASGERMVFSILHAVDVPPRRVDQDGSAVDDILNGMIGHVNQFVELRDGAFHVLREDQLIIEPLEFGDQRYIQKCVGSCRLLAAYDGEFVVYATISVDSSATQIASHTFTKIVKGVLVFPDGTSLTYADTRMDIGLPPAGGSASWVYVYAYGVFRHLLPFDIMQPRGMVYVEYRLPSDDTQRMTAHVMFQGLEIKRSDDALRTGRPGRFGTRISPGYLSTGEFTNLSVHQGSAAAVHFNPVFTASAVPAGPYPAGLVSWGRETAPTAVPRGLLYGNDGRNFTRYTLVGPVIVGRGLRDLNQGSYVRPDHFSFASHDGEHIVAGRMEGTIGGVGFNYIIGPAPTFETIEVPAGTWGPDEQWFYASSINLVNITGLSDLKQNILPIGVL